MRTLGVRLPLLCAFLLSALLTSTATVAQASHSLGIHWEKELSTNKTTFINNTAGWGVDLAVADWEGGTSNLDVLSRSSCPGTGYHCVPTNENNYGATGWLGVTNINCCKSGTNHIVSASIQLNNYYAPTATVRRHTACQEEGHAMGLNHLYGTGSCMDDSTYTFTTPVQHDFDQLNAIYSHSP